MTAPTADDLAVINDLHARIDALGLDRRQLDKVDRRMAGLDRYITGEDRLAMAVTPAAFRRGLSRKQWNALHPDVRRALVTLRIAEEINDPGIRDSTRSAS